MPPIASRTTLARAWEDEKERAAVLAKMQALAAAELASSEGPEHAAAAASRAPARAGLRSTASVRARRAAAPKPAPPPVFAEEDLRAFTLSYGAPAVYVYTAQNAGAGQSLRYVTVVAQANANGELRPLIRTATDAAHLDRTPWMRLVDAVDAEASNRASLLFELRAQNSRQFGLYRVLGDKATQIFTTGTTQ